MGAYAVYRDGQLWSDHPNTLAEAEALRDGWRDLFVSKGHPPGVWRIEHKVLLLRRKPHESEDGDGRKDREGEDAPDHEPHP